MACVFYLSKYNEKNIIKKAKNLYKIGISYSHSLKNTCCKFKKLEGASLKYNISK